MVTIPRRTVARAISSTVTLLAIAIGLAFVRPALVSQPGHAAQSAIVSKVAQLAQRSSLAPATYTFSLRDLGTGEVVAESGGDRSMVPASTLKMLGTSMAMSHFPSDRRFTTQLLLPEPSTAGKANRLVLVGGGDPSLGSPQIPGNSTTEQVLNSIAAAVKDAGITSVGTLVGNTKALPLEPIPWSWTYDDFGNYYGAPVSALSIHDNLYKLNFRPGQVGSLAQLTSTEPNLDWVKFYNEMKTGAAGSGDNGYVFGIPGSNERWLRGTVPAGNSFFIYGALPDPADTFLRLLQTQLRSQGISVDRLELSGQTSGSGDEGSVIWQHQSPPLTQMVNFTNQTSFNLYADGLFALAVQQNAGKTPVTTWQQATDIELDWLKGLGVPLQGLRIEDGSGLSRRNLVTANAMTALLHSDSQQAWWQQFKEGLNVKNGGIRPVGAVRGKDGFIKGIRTLSGVIRCQSDRQLAFSILINHFDGSIAEADAFISDVLDRVWQSY